MTCNIMLFNTGLQCQSHPCIFYCFVDIDDLLLNTPCPQFSAHSCLILLGRKIALFQIIGTIRNLQLHFFLLFCFVVQIGYLSWNYFYVIHFSLFTNSNPLYRLMEEPAAYGKLGLANLLELREECLREFQFVDVYRSIKQR